MQVTDFTGAVERNRTSDLLITNQNKSAGNTRPPARLFYAKTSLGPISVKYLHDLSTGAKRAYKAALLLIALLSVVGVVDLMVTA